MKTSASLVFLYCLLCSSSFAAPLILSPVCGGEGKWTVYLASDMYSVNDYGYSSFFIGVTNDFNNLFTGGVRYGFHDWEIGLRVLTSKFDGGMGDVKIQILHNDPFTATVDVGVGDVDGIWQVNAAVSVDAQLDSLLSVYISARWEYPPLILIDPAIDQFQGMVFSPRAGIELFRGWGFSLMFEAGAVIGWNNPAIDFNAAVLAGVRI